MIDQHYLQCHFFSQAKDDNPKKKNPVSRTYRIGEAARILNVQTSVLRFWEDEFPELQPERTPKGQRLYSEKDIDILKRIRTLLYEQGMTIEGARKVLGQGRFLPNALLAARQQAAFRPGADVPSGGEKSAVHVPVESGLLPGILAELKQIRDALAVHPAKEKQA